MRQAAQLELLDRQIRDTEREIADADQDHDELIELDTALDEELNRSFVVQETAESSYRELTSNRLELRREYEAVQDRMGEIDSLTSRFGLLAEHYRSDEERLASIAEAGSFFLLEDAAVCPVCGAAPEHHRPDHACEGNVAEIMAAAAAEIAEVRERAVELQVTIDGLMEERAVTSAGARELLPKIGVITGEYSARGTDRSDHAVAN